MDRIDLKILAELQRDARLSYVELARRVGLSKTPCAERVRKLEEGGVIRGYHADLDPVAMDRAHVVIVQVLLSGTTAHELKLFNEAVQRIPEIQTCQMIAGDFDYLLTVRTRDIQTYRSVLGEKISELPCVKQTHTYVVMEVVKDEKTIEIRTGEGRRSG
ncbi:MAG: Lrp/AsnC family transcriptional regulator, leucine-responsive regulatory protein [Azoarcus sp.]|uniref:Lrp/AsnC family transcriptional regulator, leucine-responsive regulatory protein n=1 Tax=Aromatoleum tolulyticum TaxID=34027 RepID=A0A1N6SSS0_9RHOO|nr:winged helix-turn-helix transcriptional regulator [Aromatoleum tolulyticum]MCK9984766.1 Lrp/AsnC family transcriptional regulator, leucine-responsive regulatory protein [Azoarcus sp.]SIQ43946.1 Lrp/AsnC family transcriptional regulator, leucine-responsive regulatory protein [Aromatoleum tolulyticum]